MGDMTVDELKDKKLWFLWSAKPGRNGKVTKVPFAANGGATGTDDAHKGTWVSFDDAESARNQFRASGLGLKIPKGFFLLDIYYSNASDKEVATNKLVFDSKDTAYKSVYGAVATGEEVTYSIDTGDEVTAVKLVVKGVAKKTLSMKKAEGAEDGKQRWSVTTSYDRLGEYQYFFAVYNETAVVMYGDDDGFYGAGVAANLLNLLPYDQIVYQSGYKTPDWMKNAVIYQIFPDRFYNGDVTNDTITSDARGTVQYEYMNDWYILPENPEQITLHPDTYPTYAYKGDGNWSNEIYGGDLKGITKRIDYLKALGVTVIYLNPVFESISSHRYDTSDYKNIDPILGTLGDFEELVSVAEANNMHVVLDGVFNHVSDDSVYFDRYYEYLEDGTDTIGAYPYWAYVYDAMSEKKISKEEAENRQKNILRQSMELQTMTIQNGLMYFPIQL